MEQDKALDALEPFLALTKSATSTRAAVDLVVRATSHPSTYVFAELLRTPQIQALATAGADHAVYLTLLQIFSYGTYADYERGAAPRAVAAAATTPAPTTTPLPPLNETQSTKLRQLSLLSLATSRDRLGYAHLVDALRLANARELEALVMSAVYAGLVTATLDPVHEVVRISAIAPLRDLAPGAVPKLRVALQNWSGRCEATLADLDAQIAAIRAAAVRKAEAERRWDDRFNKALDDERANMLRQDEGDYPSGSGGGGGGGPGNILPLSGASPSASSENNGNIAMTLNMSSAAASRGKPRFMKRGSNLMAEGIGSSSSSKAAVDDEDMEVDGQDSDTEAKRASRRKL